ncbi:MAG: hypothetical protein ACKO2Z_14850 [Sphaerospermopsis kisseleviana]
MIALFVRNAGLGDSYSQSPITNHQSPVTNHQSPDKFMRIYSNATALFE